MSDMINLPSSAADFDAAPPVSRDAGIRNPIADKAVLTPREVLAAIGLLSATLEADEVYRRELETRGVPAEFEAPR